MSSPSADPTVATTPKNGAYRNFQTAPTATGASTNGSEEHDPEERPAAPRVRDEHGQQQPQAGLEHDRGAGEQERVQQAPVEHGVAEDRARVVIEPDEARRGRSPACRAG